MIAVDSMPAHMAGALNIPVWVLLQKNADWRWMKNRSDSPWYPSMKLYRQDNEGDWTSVVKKVEKDLQHLKKKLTHKKRVDICHSFLFYNNINTNT